jgi:C4-dicarboxylate-specific signal transduction histidine kinase
MTLLGVDRRRAGTALLVFGVVGVALAGVIAAALVGTAIATRDLDERLQADQARLAETLDELAVTTAAAVTSVENASRTLQTSGTTIVHARDVLDELASATDSLADSLNISILGRQPFAGTAERFRTFSERVRVFSEDATGISDSLSTNADDMSALAERVALMETQLNDYAKRVAGSERIGQIGTWVAVSVLVGGLLAAWLAVAAGACAWVGWRLRKG